MSPAQERRPWELRPVWSGLVDDVIAAALIAGGAALGGAGITYLVTNRGIVAATREGDKNRTHDREVHARDRAYERKSDACVAVATAISWMQDYVIYWRQKFALSDPSTTLQRIPMLSGNESDEVAAPAPPETYKETMSAVARLFLSQETQAEVQQVLDHFTQFQVLVSVFMWSDAPHEPEGIREQMFTQHQEHSEAVHKYAASAIALLRTEVERQAS
jgi:hypothetical protein